MTERQNHSTLFQLGLVYLVVLLKKRHLADLLFLGLVQDSPRTNGRFPHVAGEDCQPISLSQMPL